MYFKKHLICIEVVFIENLIMTHYSVLYRSLIVFGYFFLLVQAVFLVTSAVLELTFSPSLIVKYYLPVLFGSNGGTLLNIFIQFCILVQLLNFIAAGSLFTSLINSYNSKCLAYDRVSMLSVAFSLALLTHKTMTGIDLYGTHVQSAIYKFEVERSPEAQGKVYCSGSSENRICQYSATYTWHQNEQCCGWTSPDDVTVVNKVIDEDEQVLPLFCCFQANAALNRNSDGNKSTSITSNRKLVIANITYNGESVPQNKCYLDSINRFTSLCSSKSEQIKGKNSFLPLYSIITIGHPVNWKYSAFKMVIALAYSFTKKHFLLPQSEGIFAHHMTAH